MTSPITIKHITESYDVQYISSEYISQYLDMLNQLSVTNVTEESVRLNLSNNMYPFGNMELFWAIIKDDDKLVGTATYFCEQKIIHNCGCVGHVEDVVVDNKYRGFGVASELLQEIRKEAISDQCYKLILDCSGGLVQFYAKNGYDAVGVQMRMDLDN